MVNGLASTLKSEPNYDGPFTVLGDVLQNGEVTTDFYISDKDKDKWEYLKGSKTIERHR